MNESGLPLDADRQRCGYKNCVYAVQAVKEPEEKENIALWCCCGILNPVNLYIS